MSASDPSITALARSLSRPGGQVRVPKEPSAEVRKAVIEAVHSIDGTCDITLRGTLVEGVSYPANLSPSTGDVCRVCIIGTDLFILALNV